MFGKETILVNATIYKKYAGGGYDTKAVRYAFDVPAGTSKDKDRLKKAGMIKLLGVTGKDHEIMGEVIATDNEGFTKSVKFNFRPIHEKMLIPKGYSKTTQTKSKKKFDYVQAGNKVMAGAKKLNDAFDAFMGGGKKTTSTKKRNTATTKKTTAKKSTKKTTNKKR